MKTDKLTNLARIGGGILVAVLALLPLHAFLTVAIGTATGQYDLVQLWKEALLLALLPLTVMLIWKTPGVWRELRRGWLLWCLLAYVLLHLLLGGLALARGEVNTYALAYALTINLRLVLVFMIGLALAARLPLLRSSWRPILLAPAVLVLAFGLLQLFALPIDFLQRFGYGQGTVVPFETVDQKLDYVRIQSTLRGSNPLGAYLVIVLAALAVLLSTRRSGEDKLIRVPERQQIAGVVMFSAGVIVLLATYSRSAYLGTAIALLAVAWLVAGSRTARRRLAVGMAALVLVAGAAGFALRDNDRVQNTFFHTDEKSTSPMSSNEGRIGALQSGIADVAREPFGRGPGTAGPASQHNLQPARIAENYYLQIGQETGWLGLGLFVAINVLVAKRLWRRRDETLPRALLASLAGIAFINLLQHAWTDDTLALLWWGLAGVTLAPMVSVLQSDKANDTQTHAKKKSKAA